jgi:hypothetical protein
VLILTQLQLAVWIHRPPGCFHAFCGIELANTWQHDVTHVTIDCMPIINVPVQAETKILLDALSILMQTPAGRVIEILASAYVQGLPNSEAQVIKGLMEAALTRMTKHVPAAERQSPVPVANHKFSRLCFKRDLIEPLDPNDSFRVETPIGTFQMTKTDFYRVFPNVAHSRSYLESGLYNYRKLPSQAEQFRIA